MPVGPHPSLWRSCWRSGHEETGDTRNGPRSVSRDGEPAERETLVRSADLDAIESLGHTREPAAAEILLLIEGAVDDRVLRKAARREIHRLRPVAEGPQALVLVKRAYAAR